MRNFAEATVEPRTPVIRSSFPPPSVVAPRSASRDTPVIAASPYPARSTQATLTVLTGMNAGRLVTLDGAGIVLGRDSDVDLILEEPGVSRRHARIARTAEGGFYVEDLGSTNGTFVDMSRVDLAPLHGGEVVQLGPQLLMRFSMVDAVEESLYRHLYDSSVHDPLTRLFNRNYLGDRLLAEVAHTRRNGGELSVLIADVDGLKQVNDNLGHLAGDRALCVVAARMKRAIRIDDVLARYGGDEFVIVAPATEVTEAVCLGERIRQSIENLHASARGQSVRLTVSVGVASLAEVSSGEEAIAGVLALADAQLYRAKETGRNRVCATTIRA